MEIINIILKAASDSFLQVTVFVGIALLAFGLINYKLNGLLIAKIETSKKIQPIIGALLGLSPGCGGAILIMPLFLRGSVSYGTVVATLIATMGDAAFVLITKAPQTYLWISALSLVVSIITGYLVDYFNVGEKLFGMKLEIRTDSKDCKSCGHIGHESGDGIGEALHKNEKHENSLIYNFSHGIGHILYWTLIIVGLVLGIMLLMQIDVDTDLPIKGLSIIGLIGTLFGIFYSLLSGKAISDDDHSTIETKLSSLKETFIHTAEETAFVGMWVFIAYALYEIGVYSVGGEDVINGWLMSAGFTAVVVGALVGLIPGCGPQIIFATLFLQGSIPFAALLANAISQDGDALFPLLVMDRKSSLWATIITTIPAIIVGIIAYLIEIYFF